MNITTEQQNPKYDLLSMKAEAKELQDKVEAFEELLDAYGQQQETRRDTGIEVLLREIRELIDYLSERERAGEKVDVTDRNYLVMKWSIEDSLREVDR